MKIAWIVVLISALTDFIITFSTALMTAMSVSEVVGLPDRPTLLLAGLGGLVVAMRTIQQALKAMIQNGTKA